jgi:hypothetical protein
VERFVDQLRGIAVDTSETKVCGVIALQCAVEEQQEAERRLKLSLRSIPAPLRGRVLALRILAARKTISLNIAITIADKLHASAIVWLDDDIVLSPDALLTLWRFFRVKCPQGAVGPRKLGRPMQNLSSRLVHRMKTVTQPAMNYPHGCCLMVSTEAIKGGIPWRYVSDDGYVCFLLIRPKDPNPMRLLQICDQATCWHDVGAPSFGANWGRIRRMQLNHLILMADFPSVVGQYYFRNILFHGLWPLAEPDRRQGSGYLRWMLKLLHFGIFSLVGLELILRGLVRRPLREVSWGGVTSWRASVPVRRLIARRSAPRDPV